MVKLMNPLQLATGLRGAKKQAAREEGKKRVTSIEDSKVEPDRCRIQTPPSALAWIIASERTSAAHMHPSMGAARVMRPDSEERRSLPKQEEEGRAQGP